MKRFMTSLLSGSIGRYFLKYAMLAILVAGGAYIGILKFETRQLNNRLVTAQNTINHLTVDNKILKENNEVFRENMKRLAVANHTNWKTAKALIEERAKATAAINNLALANRRTKQSLHQISQQLETILKDPTTDGPVAPALREVVRQIQLERAKL